MNPQMTPTALAPLKGLRVLSVEHVLAGPFATQLLQRMGAEVVKVEPLEGELGRAAIPRFRDHRGEEVAWTFARNNLGKASVAIDLKQPEGRDLVLSLLPHFDLLIENQRAGVMDRLGLGYDAASKVNPRIVYVSISGFGNKLPSPYQNQPAYGPVIEAMGGMYSITADSKTQAPRVGTMPFVGDLFTGQYAIVGALAALRRRDLTGSGSYVDVSLFDSVIALNEAYFTAESMRAPAGLSTGKGTGLFNSFAAKDGYFVIAAPREHQYLPLADIVGHPEWAADPRLANRIDWEVRCDEIIRPAVEAWAQDKTKSKVTTILTAAGIPTGPVNSLDDLRHDAHIANHEMLVPLETAEGDHVLVVGTPIKFEGRNAPTASEIPALGEQTSLVLQSFLGLTTAELERLREAQVIA